MGNQLSIGSKRRASPRRRESCILCPRMSYNRRHVHELSAPDRAEMAGRLLRVPRTVIRNLCTTSVVLSPMRLAIGQKAMGSFWLKVARVACPIFFWGALATYAHAIDIHAGQLPREDATLFGIELVLGILALGWVVRTTFRSPLAKVSIMAGALALTLAVVVFHWTGLSFFLVAGVATLVLTLIVIHKVKDTPPNTRA